nr:MAG TPA: hypothetical protein [Caudoviricetes sp.]
MILRSASSANNHITSLRAFLAWLYVRCCLRSTFFNSSIVFSTFEFVCGSFNVFPSFFWPPLGR